VGGGVGIAGFPDSHGLRSSLIFAFLITSFRTKDIPTASIKPAGDSVIKLTMKKMATIGTIAKNKTSTSFPADRNMADIGSGFCEYVFAPNDLIR
jgi:hypothetical protein